MKIIFHDRFLDSSHAPNNASNPQRMQMIYSALTPGLYELMRPAPIEQSVLRLGHTEKHIEAIASDPPLYEMALLAAGGAIMAANEAMKGEASFACVRPPGHHASRGGAWGYCAFSNLALALLSLRSQGRIESAFVLDFDAHTGDGTVDVLAEWKKAIVFNPYAETREEYLTLIAQRLMELAPVDIIAVSAGFDTYELDVGRKLKTADFQTMGELLRQASLRLCRGRRFAVLEGGYYYPHLGLNVLAFLKGFE